MNGYQLKIGLKHTSPPIWRKVIMPGDISFYDLHNIIQTIYQWDGDHLFEFYCKQLDCYLTMESNRDDVRMNFSGRECFPMKAVPLSIFFKYADKLEYIYDFGTNWVHTITMEKEFEDFDGEYPYVTKHKGDNFDEYGLSEYEDLDYEDTDSENKEYIFDASKINDILKKPRYNFLDTQSPNNKLKKLEQKFSLKLSESELDKSIKKLIASIDKMAKEGIIAMRKQDGEQSLEIKGTESYKRDDKYNINLDPMAPKNYNPFKLRNTIDSENSKKTVTATISNAGNEKIPYFCVLPFVTGVICLEGNNSISYDVIFYTQERYYKGGSRYGKNKLLVIIKRRDHSFNEINETTMMEAVINIKNWSIVDSQIISTDNLFVQETWIALNAAMEKKDDILNFRHEYIKYLLDAGVKLLTLNEKVHEKKYKPGQLAVYSNVFKEFSIEAIRFIKDDAEYEVVDMYCLNPQCNCRAVDLVFVGPNEKYGKEELFVLRFSFDTKQYTIENNYCDIPKSEIEKLYISMIDFMMGQAYALNVFEERYYRIKGWASSKPDNIGFNDSYPNDKNTASVYEKFFTDDIDTVYNPYIEEKQQPQVSTSPKIGRNDPCPCGSGKKYKKCCGRN